MKLTLNDLRNRTEYFFQLYDNYPLTLLSLSRSKHPRMGGIDRVWHHARLLISDQYDCDRCVYIGSSIAFGTLHLLAQSVRFSTSS